MPRTALIAVGGNSIITDSTNPDIPHQWDAIRETCRHLVDMIEAGWRLVITHGNGPQVGFILRRNELAAHEVHSTPLDLIVADTQGSIGYMIQQALSNELFSRGKSQHVVTLVTQVLVDENDPAFAKPTKPIGGFMTEQQAKLFEEQGWNIVDDAGRGWRRVVASPKPVAIVEKDAIQQLTQLNYTVIAAGGGGIPVVENHRGELREISGVYAVIDKDWASGLLAHEVGADLFLISTGVEKICVHFNTPQQRQLSEVTASELAAYLEAGHFPPGSMRPKVEAILAFVRQSGKPAVVTDPSNIARAMNKETGTWVIPDA